MADLNLPLPDPWIVWGLLMAAGTIMFWSPMPRWISVLQGLSYIYLSAIFLATSLGFTNSDQRSVMIRIGLMVLSVITIISVASWKMAGIKNWRYPWKQR